MLAGWVVVIVIIIHMHASLVHSNFITTELYHDVPSMPSEVDRMDGWGLYFIKQCIIWVQRMSSCSCCGVEGIGINTMMDQEVHRRRLS